MAWALRWCLGVQGALPPGVTLYIADWGARELVIDFPVFNRVEIPLETLDVEDDLSDMIMRCDFGWHQETQTLVLSAARQVGLSRKERRL